MCKENQNSPFVSPTYSILIFLTEIYQKGASRSILKCYRSAISLLVGPELALEFRLKRYFEGLAHLRSSLPKYNATWKAAWKEKLTLQELVSKLITLLALATGHRMQTFANIKIDNIEVKDKKIEIKIPDLIKTIEANRKQPI